MRRSWWVTAVGILTALVLAASLAWSAPSEAAVLSSNVTVIMNGREVVVGIDPITVKAGLLLPADLVEETGVRVVESNGNISLNREGVNVRLKIGSKNATKDNESFLLAKAPIIVSGQAFIPEEALSRLGVQVTSESGLLLVDVWPSAKMNAMTVAEYDAVVESILQQRWISPSRDTTVRMGTMELTRDLVLSGSWTTDPFVRGRTQSLLETNFLVQVTIVNQSGRLFSFPVESYFMVDDLGNQYMASSDAVAINGDFAGNLGPSASASGVLVFQNPDPKAHTLLLYVQTSSTIETIATFVR